MARAAVAGLTVLLLVVVASSKVTFDGVTVTAVPATGQLFFGNSVANTAAFSSVRPNVAAGVTSTLATIPLLSDETVVVRLVIACTNDAGAHAAFDFVWAIQKQSGTVTAPLATFQSYESDPSGIATPSVAADGTTGYLIRIKNDTSGGGAVPMNCGGFWERTMLGCWDC